MNKHLRYIGFFVMIIATISCSHHKKKPGYDFYPDMYYSQAYETFSENKNFADSITMRTPPEGSIPRDITPYHLKKTKPDRIKAGVTLENPLEHSAINIQRGKEHYNTYCLNCHGEKGDGKGFLHTSGKFMYPPAVLNDKKVQSLPDGEIFHVITMGYNLMPAHGSQIRVDNRWEIVVFLKGLGDK